MSLDLVAALVVFAFVSSITPGPNNLMLMTSGANFGFRRTLPHMLGVGLGFTLMVALVGLGVMRVFDAWPPSYTILRVVSAAYLLWLAWKIGSSGAPEQGGSTGRPFTFLQAAAFQWVNPKAWAMALSAVTLYAPDRATAAVLIVAAIFGAVNLPSVSAWVIAGQQMARVLSSHARLRAFNLTMAVLLVASMAPALLM